MAKINNVREASIRAKQEMIDINGALGVVMFQVESVNLIDYEKNNKKPTWKVICSFYTNLAGNERVKKEVYIDQESGDVVDLNGSSE